MPLCNSSRSWRVVFEHGRGEENGDFDAIGRLIRAHGLLSESNSTAARVYTVVSSLRSTTCSFVDHVGPTTRPDCGTSTMPWFHERRIELSGQFTASFGYVSRGK